MEDKSLTIAEKLDIIRENIEKAGRSLKDVTILPVSKKKSVSDIPGRQTSRITLTDSRPSVAPRVSARLWLK